MADMGRCATCRFAEKNDDMWSGWFADPDDEEYNDPDQVQRREFVARFSLACSRAKMDNGWPEDPQTLAFTMDGSQYTGELLVSPDFGCVMHEHVRPLAAQPTKGENDG
jgi:hypothetical protein